MDGSFCLCPAFGDSLSLEVLLGSGISSAWAWGSVLSVKGLWCQPIYWFHTQC